MFSIAPPSSSSGAPGLNVFAPFRVMIPVPSTSTPPVAVNVAGHSLEVVRAEMPALY